MSEQEVDLPRGWLSVPLSRLGTWSGGGTPSKAHLSFWKDGSLPWVSPKDMKVERIHDSEDHITEEAVRRSATKLIPSGSVLFVTRSGILAHTFPVAVTTAEVTVNQDLKAVTPHPGLIPDYLAWGARALGGEILRRCSKDGTTVASIDTERLMRFELPVAPLPEQQRIVEAIESYFSRLDDAVATLGRVQRNLKRYRASVLKAAVEGRLVPTEAELAHAEGRDYEPASALLERILAERRRRWREADGQGKYDEPVGPNTRELAELPQGWSWANLALIKEFSLYGPRFSSDDYAGDGRLVLRTSDISESGKVNLATAPRLPLHDGEFAKYQVKMGDLLVTRTGSLGTLAVFNDSVDAIPGAYLIQFRLASPLETSWYCFYFLKSPTGQARLKGGGAGVGRPNLNAPTIESIAFGMPPLAEQARILAEVERLLSVADALGHEVNRNRARCARLRQSILKWAFEGRLADQDPSDEPATTLLERIRLQTSASRQSASDADVGQQRRSKGHRHQLS